MRWPKYATYLFMKYYISKTNPNETFVVVDYASQVSRVIIDILLILNSCSFFSHKYCRIVIVIIVLIQHL